jgi:hypothetical protein
VILVIPFLILFGTYTWNLKSIRNNHSSEEKQQKPEPQPTNQDKHKEPVNKIPAPSSDRKFPSFDEV